ncbi:uncharacterized protein LOC119402681 [Rhipicephalus sanguineus]|uniref:uncharacterized protein LOC119402681 n=1 Tax=Rhipicephalus sanguineus TaxID=34632 RepID=UPI0020C45A5E|nr:uncharacterized protein LOC119402681 [Rhipicephalus sanguineus]
MRRRFVLLCHSGICIWEGFKCDRVANCLDYDDEHWFYGSTCLMPMLALELVISGTGMLLVTVLAFCALLRDIIKDYKLASVHMERDPLTKRDCHGSEATRGGPIRHASE